MLKLFYKPGTTKGHEMTANWTPRARKSTVTKQGARGTFRHTIYSVTLPWGETIKHADKDTALDLATKRHDKVTGANETA